MKHREYVAERERRDPAFRAARDAGRPVYAFQVALIQARLDAGLTQKELAERIGTTQSAVARWENGTNVLSVATMQTLASALGVDFRITPEAVLPVRAGRSAA